jgi:hypothetical protein
MFKPGTMLYKFSRSVMGIDKMIMIWVFTLCSIPNESVFSISEEHAAYIIRVTEFESGGYQSALPLFLALIGQNPWNLQ